MESNNSNLVKQVLQVIILIGVVYGIYLIVEQRFENEIKRNVSELQLFQKRVTKLNADIAILSAEKNELLSHNTALQVSLTKAVTENEGLVKTNTVLMQHNEMLMADIEPLSQDNKKLVKALESAMVPQATFKEAVVSFWRTHVTHRNEK
jgi:hypothetical protein